MSTSRETRTGAGSPELADAVDLVAGRGAASQTFLGGLIAGALVGAAVAGAVLVRARRVVRDRTGEANR